METRFKIGDKVTINPDVWRVHEHRFKENKGEVTYVRSAGGMYIIKLKDCDHFSDSLIVMDKDLSPYHSKIRKAKDKITGETR